MKYINYKIGIFIEWNTFLLMSYIIFEFIFWYCLIPTDCPVSWGCKIHQLLFCRGVIHPPNKCPGYGTKQSDDELWGVQSSPLLPSLPGPLWPRVVAPDRILLMGQIELNCVLILNWIVWNRIVLTFKLRTYAKLNWLKLNCFLHPKLNWLK